MITHLRHSPQTAHTPILTRRREPPWLFQSSCPAVSSRCVDVACDPVRCPAASRSCGNHRIDLFLAAGHPMCPSNWWTLQHKTKYKWRINTLSVTYLSRPAINDRPTCYGGDISAFRWWSVIYHEYYDRFLEGKLSYLSLLGTHFIELNHIGRVSAYRVTSISMLAWQHRDTRKP